MLDGQPIGDLPLDNLNIPIGAHTLKIELESGLYVPDWRLLVNADERIDVFFPDPHISQTRSSLSQHTTGGSVPANHSSAP